jgi:hypothetical protein
VGSYLEGKGMSGTVRAARACRGRDVMTESPVLSVEELESQFAVELPDREMLALVVIKNVSIANNNKLWINVKNNNVAVQVCALVAALDALTLNKLTCTIKQS